MEDVRVPLGNICSNVQNDSYQMQKAAPVSGYVRPARNSTGGSRGTLKSAPLVAAMGWKGSSYGQVSRASRPSMARWTHHGGQGENRRLSSGSSSVDQSQRLFPGHPMWERVEVPVKNTFVEFPEDEPAPTESHSPGLSTPPRVTSRVEVQTCPGKLGVRRNRLMEEEFEPLQETPTDMSTSVDRTVSEARSSSKLSFDEDDDEDNEDNEDLSEFGEFGEDTNLGLLCKQLGGEDGTPKDSNCCQSVGSLLHRSGKCKPCAWFHHAKGCQRGRVCEFCHECPVGEVKRRKKEKSLLLRKRRQSYVAPVWDRQANLSQANLSPQVAMNMRWNQAGAMSPNTYTGQMWSGSEMAQQWVPEEQNCYMSSISGGAMSMQGTMQSYGTNYGGMQYWA